MCFSLTDYLIGTIIGAVAADWWLRRKARRR